MIMIFALVALAPAANAWGCKGHEVVALIAEQHLTPHAKAIALHILAAAPVDPNLTRYCPAAGDPLADASTWADDERRVRPETAPWHFIDIPRGALKTDFAKYCPPANGCVISALSDQLRILRDSSATTEARAEALRFVIHFAGDIHQPLHASTNNDLGGNCVPVTFFGQAPEESPPGSGSFHPNLHSIWDVDIIEHFSAGESSLGLANALNRKFAARIRAWQQQPAVFSAWAWESHELAEKIAYGELPRRIPIPEPRALNSCSDLSASEREQLSQLDEKLADSYENAAAPVVQEQLAKAGARLAALLNSVWL